MLAELGSDILFIVFVSFCFLEVFVFWKSAKNLEKTKKSRPYVSMLAELGSDILVCLVFGFLEVHFLGGKSAKETYPKYY